MNSIRYSEVESVILRNVVGYAPNPNVAEWTTAEEEKEVGQLLFNHLTTDVVILEDGTKCRKVGKSRTWAGSIQYDTYVCEDGDLVAF